MQYVMEYDSPMATKKQETGKSRCNLEQELREQFVYLMELADRRRRGSFAVHERYADICLGETIAAYDAAVSLGDIIARYFGE